MSVKPTLSIILPCYNPVKGWAEQVVSAMKIVLIDLEDSFSSVNLIIVNDGSTKNYSNADQSNIQNSIPEVLFLENEQNKGKGFALRVGVEAATTDLIIYTDIDFPYHEDGIQKIAMQLIAGNEVVLGHRGNDYYDKTPWFRKVVSKSLRWVLKTFLRLPTDDSQCGLKGFNRVGAEVFLDTRIDRFLFDLEFIKLAAKRKKKIKLVTVDLKPDVRFSRVNLGVLLTELGNFLKVLFRK